MSIEIEKKYRLTNEQRQELQRRLPEIGSVFEGEEFEENTLYSGGKLDQGACALRLRRFGEPADDRGAPDRGGRRAVLTFKQRFPGAAAIKQQREEETEVADAAAMEAILN